MQQRRIVNAGLILGFVNLAIVMAYLHSNVLLAGALYLTVGGFLCFLSIAMAILLRAPDGGVFQGTYLSLEIRSRMLLVVGMQVDVVGILNMLAAESTGSQLRLILPYFLAGLFFIGSYRMVSIADSSAQEGGYIPLNYFGRPRARRFLFSLFDGCALLVLTFASIERAFDARPRRSFLQHPKVGLLMMAITSIISAVLLYERYRRYVTKRYGGVVKDRAQGSIVLIATSSILALAAAIQAFFSFGVYVYVLSAISLVGCALPVSVLWKIGESSQENLSSTESSRDSCP